jgi:hypothetical protein
MPQRFALYYAPALTDPLWGRACQWLGRDPSGNSVDDRLIEGIDAAFRTRMSDSARRYGFHATIKAPMALAPGLDRRELETALADFTAHTEPVPIGRLVPTIIEGFIALIPEDQPQALTDFAGKLVAAFDRFRAPLSTADREKRIANGKLSPRQIELLDRYGYPYVLEQFQFHMTVMDRLPAPAQASSLAAVREWFAPVLSHRYFLDRIVLFHETGTGAPFTRVADFPLRAKVEVDA